MLPAFLPVAIPEALIADAAGLLVAQLMMTPDILAPNWSFAVAENCCAPLAAIVAAVGVMAMDVNTGVAGGEVSVTELLVLAPAAMDVPAALEYTAAEIGRLSVPAAVPAAMVSGTVAKDPAPMAV